MAMQCTHTDSDGDQNPIPVSFETVSNSNLSAFLLCPDPNQNPNIRFIKQTAKIEYFH